eukprot:28823-Prorocentrum_minimum.AAC.1
MSCPAPISRWRWLRQALNARRASECPTPSARAARPQGVTLHREPRAAKRGSQTLKQGSQTLPRGTQTLTHKPYNEGRER